ncbi:MAG: hypothetical protein UZ03_NOB001003089 [Nitrospira sp. OLB3]|nr:MAG: hypothetical protein UZ03_NOB001003089 [Nitrospira sp. OLB3]
MPTATLSPGFESNRSMTPLWCDSTSIAAFSVSTSAMISPFAIGSPSRFFHCTKVPSVISAPSVGMMNSAMAPLSQRRPSSAATVEMIVSGCGKAASSKCFG